MDTVAYKTDVFYPAQRRDSFIVTNLYDLIEAVSNEVEPGEEELIFSVILDLVESGRLRS